MKMFAVIAVEVNSGNPTDEPTLAMFRSKWEAWKWLIESRGITGDGYYDVVEVETE